MHNKFIRAEYYCDCERLEAKTGTILDQRASNLNKEK